MGKAEETIAEIIGASPKPRGEGVWAWFRYHLIAIRSAYRSEYVCAQVGCPETPTMLWGNPTSAYCRLHSTETASKRRAEGIRSNQTHEALESI